MTQVISSLKPVNFNYSLSVKNVLEEGLLEHDHITIGGLTLVNFSVNEIFY